MDISVFSIVHRSDQNPEEVFIDRRFMFKRIRVDIDILGVISAEEVAKLSTQEISDRAYSMMYENLKAA